MAKQRRVNPKTGVLESREPSSLNPFRSNWSAAEFHEKRPKGPKRSSGGAGGSSSSSGSGGSSYSGDSSSSLGDVISGIFGLVVVIAIGGALLHEFFPGVSVSFGTSDRQRPVVARRSASGDESVVEHWGARDFPDDSIVLRPEGGGYYPDPSGDEFLAERWGARDYADDGIVLRPQGGGYYPDPWPDALEFRPTWIGAISERRISRHYPDRAERQGIEGLATLRCVFEDNETANCRILTERPERWRFGESALRLSRSFEATQFAELGIPFNICVHFALAQGKADDAEQLSCTSPLTEGSEGRTSN